MASIAPVQWLIEDDAFPEDTTPFIDAIIKLGVEYKIIKQRPCETVEFQHLFASESCVVFYGSLGLAKQIRKKANWIPGVYYNVPQYNCVNYYAALGRYLLNGNYIILPFGDLIRQKEFLYENIGADRTIFIRPNRGDKIFTGQLVYKENFYKDVDYFNFKQLDPSELVVVSEPRNLAAEWRFVVVDGRVVAGSKYKENERVAVERDFPQAAWNFADEIADHYNPDPAWVVDVCLTKAGEYKLMEVGCFSCAGLYACDREKIIEAVSDVALQEWQSYQLD